MHAASAAGGDAKWTRELHENDGHFDPVNVVWMMGSTSTASSPSTPFSLAWLECYLQQLRTEGKSENTRKTYLTSIRPMLETMLPGEPHLEEGRTERGRSGGTR